MKPILWLLLLISTVGSAQKSKKAALKADKLVVTALQSHVQFLADDKLEGRRTGSAGEKLAYEYISKKFEEAGLAPKGNNGSFIQAFDVREGKEIHPATQLSLNRTKLNLNSDYFPFAFSPNARLESSASMALPEAESAWFWDLKETLETNKNNPHFDLEDAIIKKVNIVAAKGAAALLVYNSSGIKDSLKFDPKSKTEKTRIPVLYISRDIKNKYLQDELSYVDLKLEVSIGDKKRTGHNVIGYIDNGASNTVIVGAHYDHLGYGEDHNSLFTGATPQIHNGADDNASGTAALIELARQLKRSKLKNNNYLFIAFSGEELGLYGSKYYTENPTIDFTKANYMINMDMIGRLNDSTHGLTIGGYGTSPVWGQELSADNKLLKIKFDSSGTGPSDHTSFYRKEIPVLFFFTGAHSDYHKPSDDADKINYNGQLLLLKYIYGVIEKTNDNGKLAFTKTREPQAMGRRSFSVSMGIMPDYTYSGTGVRADGISEGKPAEKAGLKTGDVILQIGEYKIADVQAYMQTLGKFKKGDATKVKVKRGAGELVFDIVF
ncbi:MAG: M20/M25/M40 family metallo-hydrolase [Chitinophagaceae bacterium]|nr:M20/M25/M40 family metallo-hydrolase [Chitinophagaceae bacterium]